MLDNRLAQLNNKICKQKVNMRVIFVLIFSN